MRPRRLLRRRRRRRRPTQTDAPRTVRHTHCTYTLRAGSAMAPSPGMVSSPSRFVRRLLLLLVCSKLVVATNLFVHEQPELVGDTRQVSIKTCFHINKTYNCLNFPISFHACKEYPELLYCPREWMCAFDEQPNRCLFCRDLNETHRFPTMCHPELQLPKYVPQKVADCNETTTYNQLLLWCSLGGAILFTLANLVICTMMFQRKPEVVVHSRRSTATSSASAATTYSPKKQSPLPATPRSPLQQAPIGHPSEAFLHSDSVLEVAPKSTRRSPPYLPRRYR